jgi:hypothetical protein
MQSGMAQQTTERANEPLLSILFTLIVALRLDCFYFTSVGGKLSSAVVRNSAGRVGYERQKEECRNFCRTGGNGPSQQLMQIFSQGVSLLSLSTDYNFAELR